MLSATTIVHKLAAQAGITVLKPNEMGFCNLPPDAEEVGRPPSIMARLYKISDGQLYLWISGGKVDYTNIEPVLHEIAHAIVGWDDDDEQESKCYDLEDEWAKQLPEPFRAKVLKLTADLRGELAWGQA